jgi:7-carboxy-7-deazaguanine synthase
MQNEEIDYLLLSDDGPGFHTIEGEGEWIGYPSVFMRLFGCNLSCRGWATADSPYGCDSYVSWTKKNKHSFEDIFNFYEQNDLISKLKRGDLWKITGGEPMLRQKPLISFVKNFIKRYEFTPRIDFETNGTIMPEPDWDEFKVTYTVSPKLSSNGDSERQTYKPAVLDYHVKRGSCFKFVVKSENDLKEIYRKYIDFPLIQMPKNRVWIMVCAGSRKEHIDTAESVAEICKKEGFKMSPRLHLMIWDKALKV